MTDSTRSEQAPSRMVAGALAHLATHMESGCPRAAYHAAMLLEQVANDAGADAHLRRHARELVDILERDETASDIKPSAVSASAPGANKASQYGAAGNPLS